MQGWPWENCSDHISINLDLIDIIEISELTFKIELCGFSYMYIFIFLILFLFTRTFLSINLGSRDQPANKIIQMQSW